MKRFDSLSWHRLLAVSFFCCNMILLQGVLCQSAKAMSDELAVDENDATDPDAALDELKPKAEDSQLKDESAALDPANKDALAWYMAGQKAMKRGDLQPAADAFEKAAE